MLSSVIMAKKRGSRKIKVSEANKTFFSKKDIIYSFLGALILGLIFILNGAATASELKIGKIILILIVTFLIIAFKVYVNSYRKVREKHNIKYFELLGIRLATYYAITLIVSVYLAYIFIDYATLKLGLLDMIKVIIVVSLPCALGSIMPMLLKKF